MSPIETMPTTGRFLARIVFRGWVDVMALGDMLVGSYGSYTRERAAEWMPIPDASTRLVTVEQLEELESAARKEAVSPWYADQNGHIRSTQARLDSARKAVGLP